MGPDEGERPALWCHSTALLWCFLKCLSGSFIHFGSDALSLKKKRVFIARGRSPDAGPRDGAMMWSGQESWFNHKGAETPWNEGREDPERSSLEFTGNSQLILLLWAV